MTFLSSPGSVIAWDRFLASTRRFRMARGTFEELLLQQLRALDWSDAYVRRLRVEGRRVLRQEATPTITPAGNLHDLLAYVCTSNHEGHS